jgi:hypothetical protein
MQGMVTVAGAQFLVLQDDGLVSFGCTGRTCSEGGCAFVPSVCLLPKLSNSLSFHVLTLYACDIIQAGDGFASLCKSLIEFLKTKVLKKRAVL